MSLRPLLCQVEADRHAVHADVDDRVTFADSQLQAAVTRAINAHRAGLTHLMRVELLAGGLSAQRLLKNTAHAVRHDPLVVTR